MEVRSYRGHRLLKRDEELSSAIRCLVAPPCGALSKEREAADA